MRQRLSPQRVHVPCHARGTRRPLLAPTIRLQREVEVPRHNSGPSALSQTYVQRAAEHYDSGERGDTRREDIRGIWVASDDPTALSEIQDIAPKYFPNVKKDNIVWISGGSVQKGSKPVVHTHSADQVSRPFPTRVY